MLTASHDVTSTGSLTVTVPDAVLNDHVAVRFASLDCPARTYDTDFAATVTAAADTTVVESRSRVIETVPDVAFNDVGSVNVAGTPLTARCIVIAFLNRQLQRREWTS